MILGLGTVQFGMDYGIFSQEGQPSAAEVDRILEVARRNGMSVLDTAALYGTSESVLGAALTPGHEFRVVSKTIRFGANQITPSDADRLEQAFLLSLEKLNASSIYGIMFHNASDVLARDGGLLMNRLCSLKERGLVQKIGVSVYTGQQIDQVLEHFAIDLIQLPINVLDQRLLEGGQLDRLRRAGVEVHARSVFLQGVLLMEPDALPPHFQPVKEHLARYHARLADWGITPVQAALGFVIGLGEIDAVICGVNNHKQLEELCAVAAPLPSALFSEFAFSDDAILNPTLW